MKSLKTLEPGGFDGDGIIPDRCDSDTITIIVTSNTISSSSERCHDEDDEDVEAAETNAILVQSFTC